MRKKQKCWESHGYRSIMLRTPKGKNTKRKILKKREIMIESIFDPLGITPPVKFSRESIAFRNMDKESRMVMNHWTAEKLQSRNE